MCYTVPVFNNESGMPKRERLGEKIKRLLDSGDAEQCPSCLAVSAYSWDNVDDVAGIYHIPAASCFEWQCGNCGCSWTPVDSPINHPAYTHSEDR